ncbi:MAG: class I SAM-dependent methyltransferase [Pseudomonadota bacterium]
MTGFSSEWLAARRRLDHSSRSETPLDFRDTLAQRAEPITIVDLGAGTGSNIDFLAPRLPVEQRWRLVEVDPALRAAAQFDRTNVIDVDWRGDDLSNRLRDVLHGPIDLITGSALLDLVSADWMEQLVDLMVEKQAHFHFALTYDGAHRFDPQHPLDTVVIEAFNRHQQTDKGFGPALGPLASERASKLLTNHGYQIVEVSTPWHIGPGESDFAAELVSGIAHAASDISAGLGENWQEDRLHDAKSGNLSITVGHCDLFAWPNRP